MTNQRKIKKKNFEKNCNNDLFISPIMQKPTNPTMWIFFCEKETLEESYEPSFDKLRYLGFFDFYVVVNNSI